MIYRTKNYSMFKTILGNRELDEGHLKKLERSVLKKNLLSCFPIVVNQRLQIVDGQHRLEVAKRLDLPVFYVIEVKTGIEDVVTVNTSTKSWSSQNFVDLYVKKGNENYVVLDNFCKKFCVPVSVGLQLLGSVDNAGAYRKFKYGLFVAKDVNFAYEVGNIVTEIRKHCEGGIGRSRDLITAIIFIVRKSEMDIKKLLAKIERRHLKIEGKGNVKDYLREFEDIYNFRSRSPVRLF